MSWLNYYRTSVTDFLSNPPAGLSGTLAPQAGQPSARHALKQFGYVSQESLAIYPNRLPENRGNGYLFPFNQLISSGISAENGIFPNWDCDNTGGGEGAAATEASCHGLDLGRPEPHDRTRRPRRATRVRSLLRHPQLRLGVGRAQVPAGQPGSVGSSA
ncbi:MAG: hypothetical protein M9964_14300 [Solirubrobacterales bacterium]|nr:hypothetical protein [Solirubrobacterales bacterium]